MTTFGIKLVAIGTMVVDHLGIFIWPDCGWLRMVGRLSFPLFAWLIANGVRHTRNRKSYLLRLLIFAVVSQLPYVAANRQIQTDFWKLNVLFTLALGLAAIYLVQKIHTRWGQVMAVAAVGAAAWILRVEYGAYGVLSVLASYIFFTRWPQLVFFQTIIFSAPYLLAGALMWSMWGMVEVKVFDFNQLLAPLAFILVYFYSGKQGTKAKYLFYIFYPLQFVVFYWLKKIGY